MKNSDEGGDGKCEESLGRRYPRKKTEGEEEKSDGKGLKRQGGSKVKINKMEETAYEGG